MLRIGEYALRAASAAVTLLLGAAAGAAGPESPKISDLTVRVEDHDLFLRRAGSGRPVVVLEAGFLGNSSDWNLVLPRIAATTTVVAYDRAGLGRSGAGAEAPLSRQVARELAIALRQAGLEPPYVLVGHSQGATHARVFAGLYPDRTAGLVLLDPSFVQRLLGDQLEHDQAGLCETLVADERLMQQSSPRQRMEWESLRLNESQARALPLPRLPVIVVSATKPHGMGHDPEEEKRFFAKWVQIHKEELADRNPGVEHIVTSEVGHAMSQENPEFVAEIVGRMLERVRGGP